MATNSDPARVTRHHDDPTHIHKVCLGRRPCCPPLLKADFSFLSILQAGARGNADAGWEIATGSNLGSITSGNQFRDANTASWSDNVDRHFRVGYNLDLQFSLTASASDTPKPAAALLVSTGLIATA